MLIVPPGSGEVVVIAKVGLTVSVIALVVTAPAVLHGDRQRLLGFDALEHPVALQLGGSDPAQLAEAAKVGEAFGYDEINLNVGCPSDRVQSGRFGACLMREPELVADCMAAIREAVAVPATVKCRIGVDDQDPAISLFATVDACAAVAIDTFIVHARKAWLKGLSPKENRDVPPLDYALVRRLKRERPHLSISINGGIASLDEAEAPAPASSAPTIVVTSSDAVTFASCARALAVSTSAGFCSTPVPLTIHPPGTGICTSKRPKSLENADGPR
mgnify:CR=1 FL=1